ncbi:MAG: dephospho-CoA kinase [Elusimicrobia bacterium HGW-Elusimicrobia-1]|jgi:dephospho-CoA kinase|nr:MAG: dephospho-CoA kinase [Elusimicrobia bacterium HGW-Elusimicrobia-1]
MAIKIKTVKIPPVVGITGLPASGKSTALKVFAREGFGTFSADDAARRVFARRKTRVAVKKIFGTLARKEIAREIFLDGSRRRALEKIIHPAVIGELRGAILSARLSRRPFAAEVPLLFEKNLEKMFNTIVTVAAPRRILLARMAAKGIPRRTAAGMIRAHLPQARKSSRADIVVRNVGSLKDFRSSVVRTINTIQAEYNLRQLKNTSRVSLRGRSEATDEAISPKRTERLPRRPAGGSQ